jgi:hypothetical protein
VLVKREDVCQCAAKMGNKNKHKRKKKKQSRAKRC